LCGDHRKGDEVAEKQTGIEIHYYLTEQGMDENNTYRWPGEWEPSFARMCVEEMAEHYHSRHDGWEDNNWPQEFVVLQAESNTKTELGRWMVDRDWRPDFGATKIEQKLQEATGPAVAGPVGS
jgi:hypothetical protein